jgi:L-ascorbate metabolism protein UlaG (beta-lactamase superfamily)
MKSKGISITWFGHSAFLLESSTGKSVLIDPWLDNPKAPPEAKERVHPDIILISHGHGDHLGNTIEIATATRANVVSIHEVSLFLQSRGVASATGMNKGGTIDADGIKVTMVDAKHSADIDIEGKLVPGGEAAGYVVTFADGFKVYHAGDTALFGDMKYIGQLYKPHVAILPIGDLYTMGPREAAVACTLIKPKWIVGMHYGTFPALSGTPKELRKHLPANMKMRVKELEIGTPARIA